MLVRYGIHRFVTARLGGVKSFLKTPRNRVSFELSEPGFRGVRARHGVVDRRHRCRATIRPRHSPRREYGGFVRRIRLFGLAVTGVALVVLIVRVRSQGGARPAAPATLAERPIVTLKLGELRLRLRSKGDKVCMCGFVWDSGSYNVEHADPLRHLVVAAAPLPLPDGFGPDRFEPVTCWWRGGSPPAMHYPRQQQVCTEGTYEGAGTLFNCAVVAMCPK
jgi:hypothetical protein